jgi:hypothetical protein
LMSTNRAIAGDLSPLYPNLTDLTSLLTWIKGILDLMEEFFRFGNGLPNAVVLSAGIASGTAIPLLPNGILVLPVDVSPGGER